MKAITGRAWPLMGLGGGGGAHLGGITVGGVAVLGHQVGAESLPGLVEHDCPGVGE